MTGPDRGPLTVLLDQCERIVQVHEQLRMDSDEGERVRVKTAATARRALDACREFVDRAYAATPAAASASFPTVKGRCPNCGHLTLFLAEGGHVTCSAADCDDPGMADDLLAYAQRWGDRVRSTRLVATPADNEVMRSARALIELHDDPMLCNTGGPRTAAAIDAIRRALAATPSGAEGEDVAQRIVDAFADARAIRSTGACLMVDFRDGSSADVYDVAHAVLTASPPAPGATEGGDLVAGIEAHLLCVTDVYPGGPGDSEHRFTVIVDEDCTEAAMSARTLAKQIAANVTLAPAGPQAEVAGGPASDALTSAPGLWWSPTAGLIRGFGNGGYTDAVPLTPACGGSPS